MGLFVIIERVVFVLSILLGYFCLVGRKFIRIVLDFLEEFYFRERELNVLWGSLKIGFYFILV